jgi:hypothetical protein
MRMLSKIVLSALLLAAWSARAQDTISGVLAVNVTPGSFSVIGALSPFALASNATISVFSDPGGATNLAGQVGIQYYPLNSGNPSAANDYARLLSQDALIQDSMSLGVFYARVSYCAPNTTYYYSIRATDPDGQTVVYPTNGPLPGITTAVENTFAIQSQELLVTLDDAHPPGLVITIANSNTTSVLAAVVGDGTPTNQAFFNLGDLIAASGGSNYLPTGSQLFTATVVGAFNSVSQTYSLIIPTNFSVGQTSQLAVDALPVTVGIGQDALLTGTAGSVPILLNSQSALVNFSFVLYVPTDIFSSISVQATTPVVGSASLSILSSNSIQLTFAAAAESSLEGNQQIAQLNFIAASNQPSAFVRLLPLSPQGTNSDGSIAGSISSQAGRLVIIGSQPLLDTQLEGTTRSLVLYGIPGDGYQVQVEEALATPGAWSDFRRVPMTNLMQVLPTVNPAPVAEFFRAYRMGGDPPALDALLSGKDKSLVVYGVPGTNYTLQSSGNLSATIAWYPLLNYTLTNSFQYVTNLGAATSNIFYRIEKN